MTTWLCCAIETSGFVIIDIKGGSRIAIDNQHVLKNIWGLALQGNQVCCWVWEKWNQVPVYVGSIARKVAVKRGQVGQLAFVA